MDPQSSLTNALLGQNPDYASSGSQGYAPFNWNSQGQANAAADHNGAWYPTYGSQPVGGMGNAWQWQGPSGMWVGNPNAIPSAPRAGPHGQALAPGQPISQPPGPGPQHGPAAGPSVLNQTPNHQVF